MRWLNLEKDKDLINNFLNLNANFDQKGSYSFQGSGISDFSSPIGSDRGNERKIHQITLADSKNLMIIKREYLYRRNALKKKGRLWKINLERWYLLVINE